ncbi:hypothetical protein WPS_14220 [Vulcanimicrobium alpinum]|uniref:Uncharacterized protein n=1 Tax=Vulcanimicrobium alpinum TaxID=3016050 RepID=A0AAN2C9L5_UNVUL|nr:hypothetical protein [Vulcanimicrobium alpinum]BDE06146.1 hypothetical protein WPS_14220 [Vulcanimicrobium alpinum]
MDFAPPPRQIAGSLRFLAELREIAAECAAAGVWDDELTARRRQRDDVRGAGEGSRQELQVKAL